MGADNHATTTPTNWDENDDAADDADIVGERDAGLALEQRTGNLVKVTEGGEFVGHLFLDEIADLARDE